MRLGLAELRRNRGRFASVTAALALIAFLVLILSAISDGLYFGATGALRSAPADAYAFSTDAKGSLVRSSLPAQAAAQLATAPGVRQATPLGVLLTTGAGPRGELDVAVLGSPDPRGAGVPGKLTEGRRPSSATESVADSVLRSRGVRVGSTVTVSGVSTQVVGLVSDASYQGQPTLYTSLATWREMRHAARPETRGDTSSVTAVALRLDPGVSASSVQVPAGVSVLTKDETINAIPGTAQQRSTLNAIIYTTLLVAALVVGLFFALLTLERRDLLASLKALGASTRLLGTGLFLQAVVATGVGVVVGAALARLLGLVIPEGVPILFRTQTLGVVAVLSILSGVLGAAFSLRRIARIDPATALGGTLQ